MAESTTMRKSRLEYPNAMTSGGEVHKSGDDRVIVHADIHRGNRGVYYFEVLGWWHSIMQSMR